MLHSDCCDVLLQSDCCYVKHVVVKYPENQSLSITWQDHPIAHNELQIILITTLIKCNKLHLQFHHSMNRLLCTMLLCYLFT